MEKVTISKQVLRWALERSGLEERIHQKFSKIDQWLEGKDSPTLRQLEEIAKITSTPFGYFFLPEPPKEILPIPYFRTVADNKVYKISTELLETVRTMQRRQAWIREYLVEIGSEPLRFVNSAGLEDKMYAVAERMRKELGLTEQWASTQTTWTDAFRYLIKQAEHIGVLVVVNGIVGNNTHRKLNLNEFRGFVLVDEYAPLVFINGADAKAAQMFTLAHELTHVWLGAGAVFDLRGMQPAQNVTEQACNQIAAEFLVPEKELREFWQTAKEDPEPFQAIAHYFKVSTLVAGRRALDLNLISKDEFYNFYNAYLQYEKRQKSSSSGGDFYSTQTLRLGKRFAEAIIQAVKDDRLLYRQAYQLTGLYGETFEHFSKSLQVR